MTDHQRFESLLNKAGVSRKDLAKELGMTYDSVTNQLAPSKPLPKWAKSALFIYDRVELSLMVENLKFTDSQYFNLSTQTPFTEQEIRDFALLTGKKLPELEKILKDYMNSGIHSLSQINQLIKNGSLQFR